MWLIKLMKYIQTFKYEIACFLMGTLEERFNIRQAKSIHMKTSRPIFAPLAVTPSEWD